MMNRSKFFPLLQNTVTAVALVLEKTLTFPEGYVMYKMNTYRPKVREKDVDIFYEGVLETFYVIFSDKEKTPNKFDVVKVHGTFGRFSFYNEEYGHCPMCGYKMDKGNSIPVVFSMEYEVLHTSSMVSDYNDGMKFISDLLKTENKGKCLSKICLFDVNIEHIYPQNNEHFGDVTIYSFADIKYCGMFKKGISNRILKDWNGDEYFQFVGKGNMDEYGKGNINVLFGYIVFLDNTELTFCNQCGAEYHLTLPDPVILIDEVVMDFDADKKEKFTW